MPRRTLAFITALVLALHWVVLSGVPLARDSLAPPPGTAFSTRSLAAQPLAPPPTPLLTPTPTPSPPAAARPATAPTAPSGTAPQARARAAPKAVPFGVASVDPAPTLAGETSKALAEEAPEVPLAEPVDTLAGVQASEAIVAATAASSPAPASAAEASTLQPSEPVNLVTGVTITPPVAGDGTVQTLISTPTLPVRLPPPTRLAFNVTGQAKTFTYHARAELLWQHDGSRYEARQEITAFLVGSRTQNSTGQITAQGLLPERFSDRSRSEQAAHFNYPKGRVTFSANTPEAPIGPGAQDRLSVFIQLGALLAGDPGRFVAGTQVTLTTVSARSADRWTFTIESPEILDLPVGATPTLKLQRLPRKDYDQTAELWVAPGLGYLPVRIKITQANGDFADLQLRSTSAP